MVKTFRYICTCLYQFVLAFLVCTLYIGIMVTEKEPFLTVDEFAAATKMKSETIRTWIRQGKLKAVKPGGKTWLIPRSELERLEEKDLAKSFGNGFQRLHARLQSEGGTSPSDDAKKAMEMIEAMGQLFELTNESDLSKLSPLAKELLDRLSFYVKK